MSRKKYRRGAAAPGSRFDSADPDVLFSDSRRRIHERKDRQLCAQAKTAIALTLEGECQGDVLDAVMVDDVVLDNGQLVVVLRARPGADLPAVRNRLEAIKGILRSAVAETIHRKRTPSLGFVVLPEEAPQ
jgi:ribosome-binding factor A